MDVRGHYHTLSADGATIEELARQAFIPTNRLGSVIQGRNGLTLHPDEAERFLAITPENRTLTDTSRISRRDMDEAVIALLETGYRVTELERFTGVNSGVILNPNAETTTVLNRSSARVLDAAERFAYREKDLWHDKLYAKDVLVRKHPQPATISRAKATFLARWGVPFDRTEFCSKLGIGEA